MQAEEGYQPLAPIQSGGTNLVDGTNLNSYLGGIFNLGIVVAAILAVIMIVVAGLEYMTSEAFTNKEAAKNKIKYAIIGLILALGSFLILSTINPDIVSGRLKFDSVGKKYKENAPVRVGMFGNLNIEEDIKNEEGKQKIKDFVDLTINGSGRYSPEEFVYPLIDSMSDPNVSQAQLDYLKEIQPELYEKAENIYKARQALGDNFNNPLDKETSSKTLYDNLDSVNTLFEENDVKGLLQLFKNNSEGNSSVSNFTDGLRDIYNNEAYQTDGKKDPRIETIYQTVVDMSRHGIDSNRPITAQQFVLYSTLKRELNIKPTGTE